MPNQTVTRAIESDAAAQSLYARLADASLIPRWAPVFAETIEHTQGNSYRVSKGGDQFDVDVVLNEVSMTVDYLRTMAGGRRGGAYLRVTPRPTGGCVVTMTVPVGPTSTPEEVAGVLEQELAALIAL